MKKNNLNYKQYLCWDDVLLDSDVFVDKTSNVVERYNRRYKQALIESRKIRSIDRILVIIEEFALISFDFKCCFRDKKRDLNKLSKWRHEKALTLIQLFRFRRNKTPNFNRVVEIILE